MHRVPLLLVLGLLLLGPAAPARLGLKRVSAPDPGVAVLKQTHSQGLLGPDYPGGTRLWFHSLPFFLGANQQCDRTGPRPRFSACDSLHYPLFSFPVFCLALRSSCRWDGRIRLGGPHLATKRPRTYDPAALGCKPLSLPLPPIFHFPFVSLLLSCYRCLGKGSSVILREKPSPIAFCCGPKGQVLQIPSLLPPRGGLSKPGTIKGKGMRL